MRLRRSLLAAVLLAALLPAEALAVSWGTTVKLTSTRNAVAWFGLATTGTSNVHVVFQDAIGGLLRVFYRRSTDSGATWSSAVQLSSSKVDLSETAAIASAGSRVDVVWRDATEDGGPRVLKYRRSADNGATWTGTVALSPVDGTAGVPTIAHDPGGRVIVMWTDVQTRQIQYRLSANHGATWGATKNLALTYHEEDGEYAGRYDGYPAVAAGSGVLYAVYLDYTTVVLVSRSLDGGVTWSAPYQLSTAALGDYPSIAATSTSAVVAYSDYSSAQVWATTRRTANRGTSWSAAVPLTSTTTGGPSFNPVVEWAGGAWRVALERCATLDCLTSAVYYRASTNGGASWSTIEKVSTSTRPYAVPAGVGFAGKVVVMYFDQHPVMLDSDVFVRMGS